MVTFSFSNLQLEDIDSIIIRTQMTEKVLNDKNEISKVIDFLKNVNYEKINEYEDINGRSFWIIINDLDIIFRGTRVDINDEVFEINRETKKELRKIYESLNTSSHEYP